MLCVHLGNDVYVVLLLFFIQVDRKDVKWHTIAARNQITDSNYQSIGVKDVKQDFKNHGLVSELLSTESAFSSQKDIMQNFPSSPAPSAQKIPLYDAAHSRTGDKGNDLNFSIIPHYPPDIERLKKVIKPEWVKEVISTLLNPTSFPDSHDIEERDKWVNEHVKVEIYEVRGIHSLNVVVRNILDGGVNCSRRIDRHGKCISDLILCQLVVLPPP